MKLWEAKKKTKKNTKVSFESCVRYIYLVLNRRLLATLFALRLLFECGLCAIWVRRKCGFYSSAAFRQDFTVCYLGHPRWVRVWVEIAHFPHMHSSDLDLLCHVHWQFQMKIKLICSSTTWSRPVPPWPRRSWKLNDFRLSVSWFRSAARSLLSFRSGFFFVESEDCEKFLSPLHSGILKENKSLSHIDRSITFNSYLTTYIPQAVNNGRYFVHYFRLYLIRMLRAIYSHSDPLNRLLVVFCHILSTTGE